MQVLQYLPNSLTILRLLLAVPLGLLILDKQFELALAVGVIAGITDALDGFSARRLHAYSRFGAALDPIADKVLITVAFLSSATVQLIPWYVAIVVIARDMVIISGAICYHWLIGPFEFAATSLSKLNMFVQISFCVLVLIIAIIGEVPSILVIAATAVVLFVAVTSGMDYVLSWTFKALRNRKAGDENGE